MIYYKKEILYNIFCSILLIISNVILYSFIFKYKIILIPFIIVLFALIKLLIFLILILIINITNKINQNEINLFWFICSCISSFILYYFIFKYKIILIPFIVSTVAIGSIGYHIIKQYNYDNYNTFIDLDNENISTQINIYLYKKNKNNLSDSMFIYNKFLDYRDYDCYYNSFGYKHKILYITPLLNDEKINDNCVICQDNLLNNEVLIELYIKEDTQSIKLNILSIPIIKCKCCKTIVHLKCLNSFIEYNNYISCPVCRD